MTKTSPINKGRQILLMGSICDEIKSEVFKGLIKLSTALSKGLDVAKLKYFTYKSNLAVIKFPQLLIREPRERCLISQKRRFRRVAKSHKSELEFY